MGGRGGGGREEERREGGRWMKKDRNYMGVEGRALEYSWTKCTITYSAFAVRLRHIPHNSRAKLASARFQLAEQARMVD